MEDPNFVPSQLANEYSSKTVPDSLWFSGDVQLGAGVVMIQPSTNKVLLISCLMTIDPHGAAINPPVKTYFLPGGRKDVGETMEECALREAYEESGYHCTFLPLNIPTQAPITEGHIRYPNVEPFAYSIYNRTEALPDRIHAHSSKVEYIRFWYIAQIADDAVQELGTQMADEDNYETHLLSFDEAERLIKDDPRFVEAAYTNLRIVQTARKLWESR